MPLTTLDPSTALIVIDLQQGIVNGSFIHPIGDIIDRTRALIDVFRAKKLPVVLVNVAGRPPGRTEQGARSNLSFSEGWTDLLPQLDRQCGDLREIPRLSPVERFVDLTGAVPGLIAPQGLTQLGQVHAH